MVSTLGKACPRRHISWFRGGRLAARHTACSIPYIVHSMHAHVKTMKFNMHFGIEIVFFTSILIVLGGTA